MSWKMLAIAAMFMSFGTVSAFAAGEVEVQRPEVQKPEIHKPEMQKPEIHRVETQRPEIHRAERAEHVRPEHHR